MEVIIKSVWFYFPLTTYSVDQSWTVRLHGPIHRRKDDSTVRALDLSLRDLASICSSPLESWANYLICQFLSPIWEYNNTSFIALVVYSLKKHLGAGSALQWVSVCRAQNCRNPTLFEEPLWDLSSSNNNPCPGIQIHTQVGWSMCLSHSGRQAHQPKWHMQCLWGNPRLAVAVRWVMLHFSLLQQLLEQQQGDGTCHLQACEALLPTVFTRYSEHLTDRSWAVFHPVGFVTATVSVNTFYHSLLMQTIFFPFPFSLYLSLFFFFLMYSSLGCRHLVNPFRTYQLCSSAHKPITSEALCSGTQVPDQCTKPNWVM